MMTSLRKRLIFTLLALSALSGMAIAQDNKEKKRETIEGNGKITTRDVTVSSFDALKASGIYELKLSQGNKESVRVEADENLQEYISVRNDGNRLVIDMDKMKNKDFKSNSKLKVYVTFKNLKELDLGMVGNVESEEQLSFDNLNLKTGSVGNVDLKLTASTLDLRNAGVGNLTLSGKAQNAVVKNTGVGKLQAGKLLVQTMNIENTGVGSAEVNAEKDLKVKDSFLGKVSNKGKAAPRRMNAVRV